MARKDWITEEAREALLKILSAPPFTQSADDRGHSATEAVRLPPSYDARLGEIAADKVLPYRDKSAVLRDCIHIGLQVIGLRGGQQLGISDVDIVANDLADLARLGVLVRSVMTQIRQLYQAGHDDLAQRAQEELQAAIDREPAARRAVLEPLLSRTDQLQLGPGELEEEIE